MLTPLETAAWRGFLRVHSALVRELDHELERKHGLPLHQYEVLLVLAGCEGGRMRMSELADSVLLSQSGLTRLVDRLERAGLVARDRCEQDRRGCTQGSPTRGGRASWRHEGRTSQDVHERFLDRFYEEELAALARRGRRSSPAPPGDPDWRERIG